LLRRAVCAAGVDREDYETLLEVADAHAAVEGPASALRVLDLADQRDRNALLPLVLKHLARHGHVADALSQLPTGKAALRSCGLISIAEGLAENGDNARAIELLRTSRSILDKAVDGPEHSPRRRWVSPYLGELHYIAISQLRLNDREGVLLTLEVMHRGFGPYWSGRRLRDLAAVYVRSGLDDEAMDLLEWNPDPVHHANILVGCANALLGEEEKRLFPGP
jgi:hypothetical protein